MRGRQRILCEAKQREICAMVAAGCTVEAAARYVCCSTITIRREARRNAQFHELLRQASVSAQLSPVQTMREAAAQNWRAAAWLLERTEPHRYGKRAPHTFCEAEVVDLLGRVCDAVRQETRDKSTFARIKRRVTAIAHSTLRQTTNLSRHDVLAKLDSPTPPANSTPQVADPTNGVDAHVTDQNVTNKEPILIRVSDIPLGNSSSSRRADAT